LQEQKPKRQFKTATKPKTHYDRKIVRTGYTIAVSMGKIIPKNWEYVRITKMTEDEHSITIRIDKLLGENNDAHTTQTNKANQQNT